MKTLSLHTVTCLSVIRQTAFREILSDFHPESPKGLTLKLETGVVLFSYFICDATGFICLLSKPHIHISLDAMTANVCHP